MASSMGPLYLDKEDVASLDHIQATIGSSKAKGSLFIQTFEQAISTRGRECRADRMRLGKPSRPDCRYPRSAPARQPVGKALGQLSHEECSLRGATGQRAKT